MQNPRAFPGPTEPLSHSPGNLEKQALEKFFPQRRTWHCRSH